MRKGVHSVFFPVASYNTLSSLLDSCHLLVELDSKALQRLHCGCIASSTLLELLDTGGVKCAGCSKSFPHSRVRAIYGCS